MTKSKAQLDAEIAEALTAKKPRSPPPKRLMYDVNPSSPEVIQAFLKSGYTADVTGIQEFISKHYAGWLRQYKQRHARRNDPRSKATNSYATDPADIWAGIISEFTEALREHGVHVED